MASATDRIERKMVLKAPRSRVWRAISNAEEFGNWFGVNFKGQRFVAGQPATGQITHPGHEHLVMDLVVDRVEPGHLLSFRWHPGIPDPKIDYSKEPMTLIVFELADTEGGTLLTLTESGFDTIPLSRRAEVFRMNSGGWDFQVQNIAKHVLTP